MGNPKEIENKVDLTCRKSIHLWLVGKQFYYDSLLEKFVYSCWRQKSLTKLLKNLTNKHYKTNPEPVRSECFSCSVLIFYIVGTLLSAPTVLCCATTRLKSKGKAFCLNIVSAFLQALTCLLIVGWIWSILWAMTFVQLSCKFTLHYIYHFHVKV